MQKTNIFQNISAASRSNSLQRTPRSLNEHNGLLQTVTSWTVNKFAPTKFSTPSTPSSSLELTSSSSSSLVSPRTSYMSSAEAKKSEKRYSKVLGPHCTQFLAKIGLLKGTKPSEHSFEVDDHECIKSNETVII